MIRISPWAYVNGRMVKTRGAALSAVDRGFLFGDGLFETFRVWKGCILEQEPHLRRIGGTARLFSLPLSKHYPRERIRAALAQCLRKNKLQNALLRMSVSRGRADAWGLLLESAPNKPTLTVIAGRFGGYSKERYAKGLKLRTSSYRILPPGSSTSGLKTLNYATNMLALEEAVQKGADDALMLTDRGVVAEATTSNIYWKRGKTIYTPPLGTGILPGVTRARLIKLASGLGFRVQEIQSSRKTLDGAEEIFMTSTSSWVMPVCRLDGKKVGDGLPGPAARALFDAFKVYYSRAVCRAQAGAK